MYTIGRIPFLSRRTEKLCLAASLLCLVISIFLIKTYKISYEPANNILFLLLLLFSYLLGCIRKYYRGSLLFRKVSTVGVITIEEYLHKKTRVMKGNGKTLSGVYTNNLRPTSNLYMYPTLTQLLPKTPKNILVLGGGACAYPILAFKNNPNLLITVVEINPVVIEAAWKFFPLPKTNNFKLIQEDALGWMSKNSFNTKFDFIFVDVGIVSTLKAPLCNIRFINAKAFELYKRHLTKSGSLMFNIMSTRSKNDIKRTNLIFQRYRGDLSLYNIFQVNANAKISQIQDLVFFLGRQNINLSKMKKKLKTIPTNTLLYPKQDYHNLLQSDIE